MHIKMFSFQFEGRKKQILAINSNNEIKEYKTQGAAAEDFGVSSSRVCALINGKCNTINGYAFVEADKALDACGRQKILEDARIIANMNSFYVVFPDGSYRKYNDQNQAAKDLNIQYTDISHALASKRRTVNNNVFVYADRVEKTDKDGNLIVDKEELKIIIDEIKSRGKKAFYVINPDGSYKKYYSQVQASNETGIPKQHICIALAGGKKVSTGRIIVNSGDIETDDKKGHTVVDERKVKELILEKERTYNAKPIYVIKYDGTFKKYPSQAEICDELGYSKSYVNMTLNGKRKSIDGNTFIHAYKLESLDEDGNVVLNRHVFEEARRLANRLTVYAITSDGKLRKFLKKNVAAGTFGISKDQLNASLDEKRPIDGVFFTYANDLEEVDDSGKISIKKSAFEEGLKIANQDAVYAIRDYDGSYKKYNTTRDASKDLNIREVYIKSVLSHTVCKTFGYRFISANLVDNIDETGKLVPDEGLMCKLLNMKKLNQA